MASTDGQRIWIRQAASGLVVWTVARGEYEQGRLTVLAFGSDGRTLVAGTDEGLLTAFEFLGVAEDAPEWLAAMAEAAASGRLDESGTYVPMTDAIGAFARVRDAVGDARGDLADWARWRLDVDGAPVTPAGGMSRADYVARCRADGTEASLFEALRLAPDDPAVQAEFAAACEIVEPAERYLALAVAAAPLDPAVMRSLAIVLMQTDRPDEALAVIDERDPRAALTRARILAELGRRDEAIEAYRRAVELDSDSADAHVELGVISNDPSEYERAVAVDPTNPNAHFNLGWHHLRAGRPEVALGHFERAARSLDDSFENVWTGRVLARHRLADEAGAAREFGRMARFHPRLREEAAIRALGLEEDEVEALLELRGRHVEENPGPDE